MMTNLFVRCMLFVSSYFPLMVIFSILLFYKNLPAAIVIFVVGLVSLVVLGGYFRQTASTKTLYVHKVTGLQKRDGDIMSYIASYLVPFVTFPLDGWQQIAAIIVFLLVLLIVYVNSNMIYINPMLSLAGYHLYEVSINNGNVLHYLITRYEVELEQPIRYVRMSDGIFLGRKV